MSHFAGLVILTPSYGGDLDESLEKYDENIEVDEYSKGEVSLFDKLSFIFYYSKVYNEEVENKLKRTFYSKNFPKKEDDLDEARRFCYKNKDDYCKFVLEEYPEILDGFNSLYEENGSNWNSNAWKINPETNKLEEYSTYNPDSKWDWYSLGGRWDSSIKTKSGEFVNECLLGEIDWTPFKDTDYCKKPSKDVFGESYRKLKKNVRWHFTEDILPFCFVIDGEFIEKGEMGWWGMTSNEMTNEDWNKKFFDGLKKLPEDSEVYLVDFHI